MDYSAIGNKAVRYGVGLMSGTSCDGVDAALVAIEGTGSSLRAELLWHDTTPYPANFRQRLLAPAFSADGLCALNAELGEFLAKAAGRAIDHGVSLGHHPDFIGSHGHTIAHQPPRGEGGQGSTLQIGGSSIIADHTGVLVVDQFRQRDMAAGGHGAPLVPYVDWILFREESATVAALNIGGIANITVVPSALDKVIAFDTGPGNMPIDGAVRHATDGAVAYDEDGRMAAQGSVDEDLVERLLDHPYFKEAPPKSTGRETFGDAVYLHPLLEGAAKLSANDLAATVTEAVAESIARAYENFVLPRHTVSRLIVSGGGAYNPTLMARLRARLADLDVVKSDTCGWPADAKEASAFAILANETLCGTPANVPSATGAREAVILGKITPV
jgi:anhydro-N-acetylmuramic acid kinase